MRVTQAAARAAQNKKKAFRILDLPPELIEQIFAHLAMPGEDALLNVRCVCRVFGDLSWTPFGTKYFNHLVVMLHPLSLTVLVEIANHRRLAPCVKQITVSGECIGGAINMPDAREEQQHNDLQISMLNSGMAVLIMTDVFRKLSGLSLDAVRVDNTSFRGDPIPDVVRCGSRYILKGPTTLSWRTFLDDVNSALSTVVASLGDAGAVSRVEMVIDIRMPYREDPFYTTSEIWKSDVIGRVMLLELSGELYSRWALDLLQCATVFHVLRINKTIGILEFTHPETGLFKWPGLRNLQLDEVYCDMENLKDFFNAHKDGTLQHLSLGNVHLTSGSWKEIFHIWHEQSILEGLILELLTETTTPATNPEPFWAELQATEDLSPLILHCRDKLNISDVLDAFLYDFKTTDFQHSSGYGGSHMYRVDFRLACAVHDGRAEIRDGACHLLER